LTTLTFGVNDLPYSHSDNLGTVKKGKTKGAARIATTGEVAEILEEKYHIMETFWNLHGAEIIEDHSEALSGAFEGLLQGSPVSPNVFAAGNAETEARFQKFIDMKEMDALGIAGVPTRASILGINSRMKSKRTPGRPSFQDTSLFENSFVAEVE
jgi:hypothetical protein